MGKIKFFYLFFDKKNTRSYNVYISFTLIIMQNTIATVPFSIRIDSQVKSELDREAQKLDRSASYIAIEAIKEYLAARSREKKAIAEAVEEADKGVFVSGDAMRNWISSWDTDSELDMPKADVFLKAS